MNGLGVAASESDGFASQTEPNRFRYRKRIRRIRQLAAELAESSSRLTHRSPIGIPPPNLRRPSKAGLANRSESLCDRCELCELDYSSLS